MQAPLWFIQSWQAMFYAGCENSASELQESKSGVAKAGELCFGPASLELGITMPLWLFKKVPSLHDGAMQPSCPLCLPQAPVPVGLSQEGGLDNCTCPSSDPRPPWGLSAGGTSPGSLPSCPLPSLAAPSDLAAHTSPLPPSCFPLQAAWRIRQPQCPTRQPM